MSIKITQMESAKNKAVLDVKGVTPSYINTLRRYMQSEVPTMAIEMVEFRKNSSILYDEMLSLRLGLVPLTTDLKTYNRREECTCGGEGCAKCVVKLTLTGKGPKTIYARDMKSSDPAVKPVFGDMVIGKLDEGQELECECIAQLGTGKEHAKWSPGLIVYRRKAKIKVKKQPSNGKEVAQSCPKDILNFKSGKLSVNPKKTDDCILCDACVDVSCGDVEVQGDDNEYIMTVESWGQLSPKEILEQGLSVYEKQIKGFTTLLKEL